MKTHLLLAGFIALVAGHEQKNLTFVLSASGLHGKDGAVKLDQVRIYSTSDGSDPEVFGESETVAENDNPSWPKIFWFIWKPRTNQKWKFEIHDKNLVGKDGALGGAEIIVDDYVVTGENVTIPLSPQGSLTIQKTTPIRFKLSANNIPKHDHAVNKLISAFTGSHKINSYIKCYYRKGIGGEDVKFATTSTIESTENADWDDVIEFDNYQKGQNMYLKLKLKESEPTVLLKDDDIGSAVFELDPFVQAGIPKTVKVKNDQTEVDTGATITITPLPSHQ